MEILGAADELAAVNEMLASVGEDPVENMDILPPSGLTALSILRATSRDTQEEGFWFNEEFDYELKPDPQTKEIIIPDNILRIDSERGDCIRRGMKLYDKAKKKFTFDAPVKCEVVLHVPWGDLPSVARRYFIALATEKFIESFPAAQAITDARLRNLSRAKAAFEKAAIKNADYNILGNPAIQLSLRRV